MARPLAGKRILVTRAVHQSEDINQLLRAAGAVPVAFPCVAILLPEDCNELDTALRHLAQGSYDWLVLSSSNAAWVLACRLHALQLQPDWSRVRLAAVGQATASAILEHLGTTAEFVPEVQTGEALAASLPIQRGARVLLPQSAHVSSDLYDRLQASGAQVTQMIAYRAGLGAPDASVLLGNVDALTFTSPVTVQNFLQLSQGHDFRHHLACCIGPTTARVAQRAGFTQCISANPHSIEGMIAALWQHQAR